MYGVHDLREEKKGQGSPDFRIECLDNAECMICERRKNRQGSLIFRIECLDNTEYMICERRKIDKDV